MVAARPMEPGGGQPDPLRDHEPMGRYSVRFDRIGTRWLRRGLQWHCKVGLDTGVLSWSTVHRRVVAVHEFDRFLAGRGVDGPWLADHAAGMRALMLDFLGHLRARPVTRAAAPASGCRRRRCSAWPAMWSSSTCS